MKADNDGWRHPPRGYSGSRVGGNIPPDAASLDFERGRLYDAKNIFIYDVRESRLEELKARYGVNPAESNLEVIKSVDYVFSCVRSEYAVELAEDIAST